MKKGCLAFFVFLIAVFLVFGIVANKGVDYKEVIKETDKSCEVSAVLSEGGVKPEENSVNDEEKKQEIVEQLRELGYLD